jgi:hypothetical protein
MIEDHEFPTQDEHFHGLEEEIHSDEANNPFVHCCNCGELCEQGNLIEGVCEDCWDDKQDDPYYVDDEDLHDAALDLDIHREIMGEIFHEEL